MLPVLSDFVIRVSTVTGPACSLFEILCPREFPLAPCSSRECIRLLSLLVERTCKDFKARFDMRTALRRIQTSALFKSSNLLQRIHTDSIRSRVEGSLIGWLGYLETAAEVRHRSRIKLSLRMHVLSLKSRKTQTESLRYPQISPSVLTLTQFRHSEAQLCIFPFFVYRQELHFFMLGTPTRVRSVQCVQQFRHVGLRNDSLSWRTQGCRHY